jgi:hypothetical protein
MSRWHPTVPYPYETYTENACPECGGAGQVLEQIDEERLPVPVYCPRCQRYCRECKRWVAKKNHVHPA